jgi:hypothetical protein
MANQNPPLVFALTPAIAINGVVDYTTSEGRKLYSSATYKLEDELYDCEPDGLYQFLQSLSARAQEMGWDDPVGGTLMIPQDIDDPLGDCDNLVNHYGHIKIEKIRKWEEEYINKPVRPAQDSYLMHKCLMNSITKKGKDKITIWKDHYTVHNLASGNLLLKIIIRESHLDTNATISTIRGKLSSLDTYMLTINCDIIKFNSYVKLLLETLAARGETTKDLLEFLFKGYGAVKDNEFKLYIKRKLENYEEGYEQNPDDLMTLSANKFKLRKENGTWDAPSADEEKILALHAEIKDMKKQKTKAPKGYLGKKEGKGKKPSSSRESDKPTWMDKPPKDDDLKKSRTWKDKPWWYCHKSTGGQCAGVWRCHKPTDCKGRAHIPSFAKDETPTKKVKFDKDKEKRTLKLAKAYQAVTESEEAEAADKEDDK